MEIEENDNTCPQCGKQFTRKSTLIGHMKIHNIEYFSCESCPELFKTSESLSEHVENVHTNNNSRSKKALVKTHKSVTKFKRKSAKEHRCKICHKIFKKPSNLERHNLVHNKVDTFRCDLCNPVKYFSQKSALKKHQLIHAGVKNWTCLKCGIGFVQKGNLIKHMKKVHPTIISKDVLKYPCNSCTCHFKSIATLNIHISRFHKNSANQIKPTSQVIQPIQPIRPDAPRILEVIQIQPEPENPSLRSIHYQSKDQCVTLKVEEKFIDGERFLQCPGCQKVFRKPSDLIRHYRSIHKKERIVCSICSKSFSIESTLKNHIRVKHKSSFERTSCTICQRKFNSLKKLRAHMEIHNESQIEAEESMQEEQDCDSFSESRPYQCLSCPAAFKQYNQLKQHETCHMIQTTIEDKQKPECHICMKSFSSISALNLHKKLHENRIHKCNICDTVVTTERSLKRHFLSHTSQKKKYKCSYCPEVFSNFQICQKHIEAHKHSMSDINLGQYLEIFIPDSDHGNIEVLQSNCDRQIKKVAEISDISTNYDRMIIENAEMFQIQPTLVDNSPLIDISFVELEKANNSNKNNGNNNLCDENGMRFIRLNDLPYDQMSSKHTNISIEQQDSHFMDFEPTLVQMTNYLKSENVEFLPDATIPTATTTTITNITEDVHVHESTDNLNTLERGSVADTDDKSDKQVKQDVPLSEPKNNNEIFKKPKAPEKPSATTKHQKTYRNLCEICQKRFAKPSDLRRHLHTHLKIRPFKCSFENCDKSFTLKGTLKRHLMTHADVTEKPSYPCSICGKSLSSKTNLNLHLQLHADNGEVFKQFQCDQCSMRFRTKGNLKSHIKLVHEKSAERQNKDL